MKITQGIVLYNSTMDQKWITYSVLVIYIIAIYYNALFLSNEEGPVNGFSGPKLAVNYRDDYTADASSKGRSWPTLQKTGSVASDVAVTENVPSTNLRPVPTQFDLHHRGQMLTGKIIRVKHLVEGSTELSEFEAVGEGLHHATVGDTSSIIIKLDPTRTQNFKKFSFSILAVGKNHIFAANPHPVAPNATNITFTYVPTFPGDYDVYVEEIFQHSPWQKQIPGSPFRLVVQGDEINTDDLKVHTDNLPSCQTISQKDLSWVEGEWMTRKLTGRKHGVLRSGWVFQPKLCSFDIFTTDDIQIAASSKVPKTIAIIGSSRERGIFLSLVDLALRKHEKSKYEQSDLPKCWGFMEFQLGNLHFIYQDLRLNAAEGNQAGSNGSFKITCHNHRIALNGTEYFNNTSEFIEKTLFGPGLWPDVVFVDAHTEKLSLILEKIPPSWNGTIYPVVNFKVKVLSYYNAYGRLDAQRTAKASCSLDSRVNLLNGFALSTGMRHATESSPFILSSHHFHRSCEELDGEMRVCGNPTEIVAQFLLGQVIAPKGKDLWMKSIYYQKREKILSVTNRIVRFCYDCPQSLLPYHIKSKPDLLCYESTVGLHASSNQTYKPRRDIQCPEECMKTKPVKRAYVQSGSVAVRRCSIL